MGPCGSMIKLGRMLSDIGTKIYDKIFFLCKEESLPGKAWGLIIMWHSEWCFKNHRCWVLSVRKNEHTELWNVERLLCLISGTSRAMAFWQCLWITQGFRDCSDSSEKGTLNFRSSFSLTIWTHCWKIHVFFFSVFCKYWKLLINHSPFPFIIQGIYTSRVLELFFVL